MNQAPPRSDSHSRWRRTAQVLKALGHPSRLFLVDRLAGEGEPALQEAAP